jgi:hypothetical protein
MPVNKFPTIFGTRGWLSCSQISFTGPHHEPVGFSLHRLILFVCIQLNNILLYTTKSPDWTIHIAQQFLSLLMSVRPPLVLFVCASPPRRIWVIFNIGDLTQNCRESPDIVKTGKNISYSTLRPKYFYTVDSNTKHIVAIKLQNTSYCYQKCKVNPLLHFRIVPKDLYY